MPDTTKPALIHNGIPRIFALFQLFVCLQSEDDKQLNEFSLKEFFAFERTLFNYNGYYFMEEQIIYALKQGVNSLAAIDKMFSDSASITNKIHSDFDSIISKLAVSKIMILVSLRALKIMILVSL